MRNGNGGTLLQEMTHRHRVIAAIKREECKRLANPGKFVPAHKRKRNRAPIRKTYG